MLIRITDRCHMNCNHCMVDARPDGAHMTEDVFRAALEFCKIDVAPVLMLSGGEPSEHPELIRFLDMAATAGFKCAFLTNGMYLFEKPELARAIAERVFAVQVTNDVRYYPKRLPGPLPDGMTCDTLRVLSPFGRARRAIARGKLKCTQHAPPCFNLRSATRHFGSVELALAALRTRGRMCIPSINVDGIVVAGEAPSCAPLGTVGTSAQGITRALLSLRCGKCGLVEGLSAEHKRAIGELLDEE